MGHTPGPWAVAGSTIYALNENGVSRFQAQISAGFLTYPAKGRGAKERTTEEEVAANARLIVAAPDLLEACKSLVANLTEGDFISTTRIEAAEAAIRKAEGRS